jgi:hypothetical protein
VDAPAEHVDTRSMPVQFESKHRPVGHGTGIVCRHRRAALSLR